MPRWRAGSLLARLRDLAGTPTTVEGAHGRLKRRTRRVVITTVCGAAMVGAVPSVVALSDGDRPEPARTRATGYSRYLRTGTDIPPKYYDLIVRAGTMCEERGLSPVLIAAMLKTESNFDSNLKDPDMDEYGIARWTPRVLRYHLPPDRRDHAAEAAMRPEESIPAMGGFFCGYGSELTDVPGHPALNLAAAYRTSTTTVVKAGGIPARRTYG